MSKPLIEGGYILLSRKLIESEIMSKPPLYLKIWVWLLLNAQHTNYKGLERGSYKTSIPDIMDAMTYYVGYRKERPTKKEIFGVIEWLRNPHEGNGEGSMMVTTKVTHGFVYKVQNYSVYQEPKNYEGNDEGLTKVPMISNGGNNNNKNGFKNVKNDKKKDINIFLPDSIEYKLSLYLKTLILKNNSNARTPSNLEAWSKTVDKIIRLDHRTSDQIKLIIKKSQTHSFWMTNILSMEALRAQFDKLTMATDNNSKSVNKKPLQSFDEREYTEEDISDLYLDPTK